MFVSQNIFLKKKNSIPSKSYLYPTKSYFKNKNIFKTNKIQKTDTTTITFDTKTDLVFWYVYYCIYNGNINIEKTKLFETEKKIKYEWINKLNNEYNIYSTIFKKYKIKKNDVISNLGNDTKMDLNSLFCISIIFNLNICCIKHKMAMMLFGNSDFTIKELDSIDFSMNENNIYVIDIPYLFNNKNNTIHIKQTNIEYIQKHYLMTSNIDKPLYSIQSYTLKELQNICEILQIPLVFENNGKKKTKKDLYSAIKDVLLC